MTYNNMSSRKKFHVNDYLKKQKAARNRMNETQDPFDPAYKRLNPDSFKSIDPANIRANVCKVYLDNNAAKAQKTFYQNDIVEICPCKIVEYAYIEDYLREIAFKIEDNKFVIPFGYAQYYQLSSDAVAPNCDYEYDPHANAIVITAIKTIPKDSALVLASN